MPAVLLGARPKPRDFLRHKLGKSFSFYLRYALLERARSSRTRLWGDTTMLGIAEQARWAAEIHRVCRIEIDSVGRLRLSKISTMGY